MSTSLKEKKMTRDLTPEETRALATLSIFVDKRKRYVYVDRFTKKGYQIGQKDLSFLRNFSLRFLIALFVYIVGFSVLSIDWWIAALTAVGGLAVSELIYRMYFLKKLPEVTVKAEDAKSVSWLHVQISEDKDKLRKKLISFGLLTVISFVFIIIANYQNEYLLTMAAFQAYLFFYTGLLIYGFFKKN
ncbi:MAG: hypothetical protein CVU90_16185 [Firmicutes bacterium HGW-Firmicutes-15]|nr:MAG: hypothetical protein CVU90_16185 [Firmicutes bacterium HGW-Firmicutes-15]